MRLGMSFTCTYIIGSRASRSPLVHEVLVRYNETVDTDEKTIELASALPEDLSVMSWKQVNPELGFADDMMAIMLVLVLGIIMMALLFGIINNMLMAFWNAEENWAC